MKRIIVLIAVVVLSATMYSQAPNAFNYQAVLRNSDGTIKADEAVAIQIEILQGSIDGSSAYLEIHNTNTSSLGLVKLEIGSGTSSDDISTIDWGNGPYFLNVTVNGTKLRATQLLSVPYALHSKSAETITGEIAYTETDPSVPTGTQTGEMQYWDGSEWVTVSTGNEGQVLTFVGGTPVWKTRLADGEVENPTTGKIWMNRNLGASQVATSSTDANTYGDLYQWGRAADGHQLRTSGTTSTLRAPRKTIFWCRCLNQMYHSIFEKPKFTPPYFSFN